MITETTVLWDDNKGKHLFDAIWKGLPRCVYLLPCMRHILPPPQVFPTVSTVVSLSCVSLCSSWGPRRSFRLSITTLLVSGQRCSAISRHGSQKVAARYQLSSRLLLTVHLARVSEFGLDCEMNRGCWFHFESTNNSHSFELAVFVSCSIIVYVDFSLFVLSFPVWLYISSFCTKISQWKLTMGECVVDVLVVRHPLPPPTPPWVSQWCTTLHFVHRNCKQNVSLVPSPHAPPGEKWSGEQKSRIGKWLGNIPEM